MHTSHLFSKEVGRGQRGGPLSPGHNVGGKTHLHAHRDTGIDLGSILAVAVFMLHVVL